MISGPTALDHEQPAASSGLGRALMTSTFCGMACRLYLGFDFRQEFICPWFAFHERMLSLFWGPLNGFLKIMKNRFRRERLWPRRRQRPWCLRFGWPGWKIQKDGLGLSHWPDALGCLMGWRWRWRSPTTKRTNTVARPTRTQATWSLPNMHIAPGKFSPPAHSRAMGRSRRSLSSSGSRRRRRARAFPRGWCPWMMAGAELCLCRQLLCDLPCPTGVSRLGSNSRLSHHSSSPSRPSNPSRPSLHRDRASRERGSRERARTGGTEKGVWEAAFFFKVQRGNGRFCNSSDQSQHVAGAIGHSRPAFSCPSFLCLASSNGAEFKALHQCLF